MICVKRCTNTPAHVCPPQDHKHHVVIVEGQKISFYTECWQQDTVQKFFVNSSLLSFYEIFAPASHSYCSCEDDTQMLTVSSFRQTQCVEWQFSVMNSASSNM